MSYPNIGIVAVPAHAGGNAAATAARALFARPRNSGGEDGRRLPVSRRTASFAPGLDASRYVSPLRTSIDAPKRWTGGPAPHQLTATPTHLAVGQVACSRTASGPWPGDGRRLRPRLKRPQFPERARRSRKKCLQLHLLGHSGMSRVCRWGAYENWMKVLERSWGE